MKTFSKASRADLHSVKMAITGEFSNTHPTYFNADSIAVIASIASPCLYEIKKRH